MGPSPGSRYSSWRVFRVLCEVPTTAVSKCRRVWLRDGRYWRHKVTSGWETSQNKLGREGKLYIHKAHTSTLLHEPGPPETASCCPTAKNPWEDAKWLQTRCKKNTPHFTQIQSQTRLGVWGKTDTQTDTQTARTECLKKKINPGGRSRDETSPYRTGARFE